MLLEDSTFEEALLLCRSSERGRYRDDQDPEVERLLNSSPPLVLQASTYESFKNDLDESSLPNESHENDPNTPSSKPKSPIKNKLLRSIAFGDEFKRVEVLPRANDDVKISGLSKLFLFNKNTFITPQTSSFDHQSIKGKIQLTIYLPDCTSIIVMANIHSSFDELIRKILSDHKEQNLKPPLYYHAPEFYELRMHDVDGEPDLDLPALDRKKTMKDMMFDTEYCLAEIDEDAQPPALIESFDRKEAKLLSSSSTVILHFPQGDQIQQAFEELTTLRDVLRDYFRRSQKKTNMRFRLLTEEYVFFIYSPEEQARLKLMSPIVDPNATILSLGTREFQLQKRVYADSQQQKRASNKPTNKACYHRHNNARLINDGRQFNAATAGVYQEWQVTKKNSLGFNIERILGIDGSGVYNLRRDIGATHEAVKARQISHIRNIEPVEYDRNAFKITWEEDREVVEIEYTCFSETECSEIIAKLSFLISIHNQSSVAKR